MTILEPLRQRLTFEDFQLVRFPDGRSRISVRVGWTQGRSYVGKADGGQTREGEIRASAHAAVRAAEGATEETLELELRGAKGIRIFDAWVVVVMIRARVDGDPLQLLGAYPCPDEDTPRGAALAVLDATNRILPRFLPD